MNRPISPRLPRRSVGYATHELAELLVPLTAAQRAAINRIVWHVYMNGGAWADLFHGPDRICAETTYYRRGRVDPETGKRSGYGWGHDPQFQAALQEAVRLAFGSQGV